MGARTAPPAESSTLGSRASSSKGAVESTKRCRTKISNSRPSVTKAYRRLRQEVSSLLSSGKGLRERGTGVNQFLSEVRRMVSASSLFRIAPPVMSTQGYQVVEKIQIPNGRTKALHSGGGSRAVIGGCFSEA